MAKPPPLHAQRTIRKNRQLARERDLEVKLANALFRERQAYERGVREAAEEAGTFVRDVAVKPVLANACRLRILALLDQKGGGDG